MKERISITLDSQLVGQLDGMVDGKEIKNRSHAIELLLSKALKLDVPRKAVLLAGGKGTRLRPLTYEIPKGLIPVQGKTLTEHLFDLFKRYGITNIVLSIGHMGDKIKQHFGNGEKFGVQITYAEETQPLGTAGPLRLCKRLLQESFIVSNGDELKDINIPEMYKFHKQNNALATIALTTVSDPSAYGVARLSGNRILEFVEKPAVEKAPSKLINSGFYILEPAVLELIPEGFAMLETAVFPKLAKQGKLFGYPFSGQWFDTGTLERYERAIKEWRGISKNGD
ncbi:NTP transferase domain-containing protein [Candidatus Woesearchaeota archaeon]|nr:NTP transferase domain-containing protein [Candidatus Woesearchaeota archaeon]